MRILEPFLLSIRFVERVIHGHFQRFVSAPRTQLAGHMLVKGHLLLLQRVVSAVHETLTLHHTDAEQRPSCLLSPGSLYAVPINPFHPPPIYPHFPIETVYNPPCTFSQLQL
jgi:hypothetical protein